MKNRYIGKTRDRSVELLKVLKNCNYSLNDFTNTIELGCCSGETIINLSKMSKQNFLGYDIAIEAKNRNNLKFITIDLNTEINNIFSNDNRSLYFALDVIEHLSNPFRLIKKFEAEANKGDILVISSPNFASVRMLLAWLKGILPKEDVGYFDYSHMHWLAPKSFLDIRSYIYKCYIFSERKHIRAIQCIWPSRLCSQFFAVFEN